MIKPAGYFDLIPRGDLLLRAIARNGGGRLINLVGHPPEVRKVATAILAAHPHVHFMPADVFRRTPSSHLVFDLAGKPIVVVNYPRHAKGMDTVTLQVTPYSKYQIAAQLQAKTQHIPACENIVDLMFAGPLDHAGLVALYELHTHYQHLAGRARQHLRHLKEIEMYSNQDLSKMTPEEWRACRDVVMSGKHAADVKTHMAMQQRAEKTRQREADPIGYKLQALQQTRDEHAKAGRNTAGYDATIAELEQQKTNEAKRAEFLKSDEYQIVSETNKSLYELVKQHDPGSLAQMQAAYEMYAQHQDSERYTSEAVSISKSAWMADLKLRRDAEQASLKQQAELARADYERFASQHEQAKVDAMFQGATNSE